MSLIDIVIVVILTQLSTVVQLYVLIRLFKRDPLVLTKESTNKIEQQSTPLRPAISLTPKHDQKITTSWDDE